MIHQLVHAPSLEKRPRGRFSSPPIAIPDLAVDDTSAAGEVVCLLHLSHAEWMAKADPIVIRFMVLDPNGWHPYVTATWNSTQDPRGTAHPDNIPSASMWLGGKEQLRGKQLRIDFDVNAPEHTFGYSVEIR